jgi:hypothetical protein
LAFYNASDEQTYWTGQIFGTMFLNRLRQANPAYLRDLNWEGVNGENDSNCSLWEHRKPTTYLSWQNYELRQSIFVGRPTYTLNGPSNDYSATFGSGSPTDKETIIVFWGNTASNTTATFNLNGTGALPIKTPAGEALTTTFRPTNGLYGTLVYDKTLNGWLHFGGTGLGSTPGFGSALDCGVPPEVFLKLNAEIGSNPWHVSFYLSADPVTDYESGFANYVQANYPSMHVKHEIPNEVWNGRQYPTRYANSKATAYAAVDSAWSPNDFDNWAGKVASTVCQSVSAAYGGDRNKYDCVLGVHTAAGGNTTPSNPRLLSTRYMNQNPARIPIQSGFTQTPAYQWVTQVAITNYWQTAESYNNQNNISQAEIAEAYCYYYGGRSCKAPSEILYDYVATSVGEIRQPFTIAANRFWAANYQAWATSCAGARGRCPVKGTTAYEGGLGNVNFPNPTTDYTVAVSTVTNANPCILHTARSNGAVAGMPVTIQAASGGTWITVVGSTYAVQSSGLSTTNIPINLDCTSLGMPSGLTLAYTGSAAPPGYVNFFQAKSQYLALNNNYTALLYSDLIKAGVDFPSQFTISESDFQTNIFNADIFGYYVLAGSSSATIANTRMTLGGTITGKFEVGDVIFGNEVTPGTTVTAIITGNGATPGDTLQVSPSQTVSAAVIIGTVNGLTDTAPAWSAIRQWNGNPSPGQERFP